jgi:GH35 family endo-1,4-beta-xylanase
MNIQKLPVIIFFAVLFAACAPASTPTPTRAAINTPLPTETATLAPEPTTTFTPEPTATPVNFIEGFNNVPEPDDDFINQVVSENYLKVMGLTRDQVDLVYIEHTGIDGQTFIVMLDSTTGLPLAVYTDKWQKATLRFFGRQVGIVMGTDTAEKIGPIELGVMSEFDRATIQVGNEWNRNEPQQGKYDKTEVEKIAYVVADLKLAGISEIIAHPLTTAGHASWLDTSYSQEQLRAVLKNRVEYFIDNNPNADFIVVVNEPYVWDSRSNDVYYQSWGNSYDYIVEAFQMARNYANKKNRDIKLIYNDSDNHYSDGITSKISRKIVTILHEQGLIDFVGMQMHIGEWREGAFDELMVPQMPAEIEFYRRLGVPVLITELTYQPDSNYFLSDAQIKLSPEEFEKRLSYVFGEVFRIAIESGNVKGITFWGLTDKWFKLDNVNWYMIFDEHGQPKQSYYIVLKTLYEAIKE